MIMEDWLKESLDNAIDGAYAYSRQLISLEGELENSPKEFNIGILYEKIIEYSGLYPASAATLQSFFKWFSEER